MTQPVLAALIIGLSWNFDSALLSQQTSLPILDRRLEEPRQRPTLDGLRKAAFERLNQRVPGIQMDLDAVTAAPRFLYSRAGFLTGRLAGGEIDAQRLIKRFIDDNAQLFGHGSVVLQSARITREYFTAHSGMKTVVWEQLQDGIPVFEALLVGHVTRLGELVSLSSQFLPDVRAAAVAGVTGRTAIQSAPPASVQAATASAAKAIGEGLTPDRVELVDSQPQGPTKRHRLRADVLSNEATAELVWLPMDRHSMRLCWRIVLASRRTSQLYQVLIDAQTAEPMVRHCWTAAQVSASYKIYPSDSSTPFSPGHATHNPNPGASSSVNQPTDVATFPPEYVFQVDTNFTSSAASTSGWILLGDNRTIGNNVDVRLVISNNVPEYNETISFPAQARPTGTQVGSVWEFYFIADPTVAPKPTPQSDPASMNQKAAVVNAFYWANWMHDKLWDLGFTEAAGNFQQDNFGRGGLGQDAILVNVQWGAEGGERNAGAMISDPRDGQGPNYMHLRLFDGPVSAGYPERDPAMDAETVLHEYTHAMVNRVVGHGVGVPSDSQWRGLDEAWADFFALALLSQSGDNPSGNYAANAYSVWQLLVAAPNGTGNRLAHNYYFGKMLYPYSTDLNKNPIRFRDIQPTTSPLYPGVPYNDIYVNPTPYFFRLIQFWCTVLWEARANLISKHPGDGNDLILRRVLDGMKIGPAKPTPIQARDAIILADRVANGGDANELWAAFAKRGMGWSAAYTFALDEGLNVNVPTVVEGYDLPPSGAGTVPGNKADFNFDTWSDLVFQNASTRALKVWYMQTSQRLQEVNVSVVPDVGWSLVGSADVNRDGKADFLFQHMDGWVAYWLMDGITFLQGAMFSPSHPGTGWRLAGSGKYNLDPHDDLIYQHTDSTLAVWLMNGANLQNSVVFDPSAPGHPNWKLVGAGDFNHDGQSDLVFQFQGASAPPLGNDGATWVYGLWKGRQPGFLRW